MNKDLKDFESKNQTISKIINNGLEHQIIWFIIWSLLIMLLLAVSLIKFVNKPLQKFKIGLESFFKFLENSKNSVQEIDIQSNDEFGAMSKSTNKSINVSMHLHSEITHLMNIMDKNIITSETDEKGIITYASSAFCKISGYTKEELLGKSHNIVRHPDMSKELFQDLWETIKSGKIWKGEVKNLKKDGGFYWVDVIITPKCKENGINCGYTAIRQDITAKKEVESLSKSLEQKVEERTYQLKQNQEQMVFVSQYANLGFWTFNPKVGDLFVNDIFVQMLGYDDKEVLQSGYENEIFKPFKDGLAFWEKLLHPDDAKRTGEIITAHINGETPLYKVEYRMKRADGSWMWSMAVGRIAQYDQNGKPIKFNGVNINIDEAKTAQEELNNQKNFIDSVMNTQESFVITSDGKCLRTANKAFLDFYNVANTDEFITKYGDCICDTFNTTAPNEYIQKQMGEEKWVDYIYNRPTILHKVRIQKDNSPFIFTITTNKLIFNNEEIKTAVFTDITELEKTREEVEKILANILLPVLITSQKDRKILYANKYAEIQYEKSVDEIVGSDIDNIYTIKGQQDHIIEAIQENGKVENMEESFKTATGKEFTALLSVTPITYGNTDSYIGMVTDITKQKAMENEVRAIHKHTRESIEYAALIQHALIPSNDLFREYFKDYLTIWHPKDIVGGDVYLFEELRNKDECLLMVVDCTGHGVPGAFVTMLVKAIERQIVSNIIFGNEVVSPSKILSIFNKTMKHLLKQEDENSISNAGFDGGVLYYNKKERIIKYSGAETPLFYIENENLKIIKGDRQSIGYKKSNANFEFKEHIINVADGMSFYLTTDGYLDQNGGEKGFPFGKSRFNEIITTNANESLADVQEVLLNSLLEYQGDEERNDDVTIIGFKI